MQLISFRNEMDGEFKCNAKKQGINMWEKIQGKMIAACDNFSKSAEACRKKWKVVYRQYCTDKRLLQVSGEGRKVTCKFFEEIDQSFNNLANVRKLCHGDARGTSNPRPPNFNQPDEGGDSIEAITNPGIGNEGDSEEWKPRLISVRTYTIVEESIFGDPMSKGLFTRTGRQFRPSSKCPRLHPSC